MSLKELYQKLEDICISLQQFDQWFAVTGKFDDLQRSEYNRLKTEESLLLGKIEKNDDEDFQPSTPTAVAKTGSVSIDLTAKKTKKRDRSSSPSIHRQRKKYDSNGHFCFCIKNNGKPRRAKQRERDYNGITVDPYYVCANKCCRFDTRKSDTMVQKMDS